MDTLSAGRSDQGRRKNNEDFIAYFEPTDSVELKNYGCLYIVADGVGGAAKGERASQYAAQKVLFDYYQPYEPDPSSPEQLALIEPLGYLRNILKQVNGEINDYASQNNMRMATTIVAAVVRGEYLYVTNVGDSRAYLIRNGVATQVNRDHSLVGEMVEHDEMTEADAMASSIKNRLTRSLGGDPDVIVDTYPPLHLQSGDKILLCSDGLTRYALKEDVANMTMTGKPEDVAKRLVKFANDSGGADNVSVIVVTYKPVWSPEIPTTPSTRPQDVDLETITPAYLALPSSPSFIENVNHLVSRLPIATIAGLFFVFTLFIFFAAYQLVMWGITPKLQVTPTSTIVFTNTPTTPTFMSDTPTPTATQIPTNAPTVINEGSSSSSIIIVSTNSCEKNFELFKTKTASQDQWLASIHPNEIFHISNIPERDKDNKNWIWLKSLDKDSNEIGWILFESCFKFSQGERLVTLNQNTSQFEITPPSP